jgi:LmbE family N-acetylglucosaminyl deacetylase
LPDGAVLDRLPDLVTRLTVDLAHTDVVLTHPFEGGHIDHDACAFAVWQACANLARTHGAAPDRVEFSGYHSRRGKVRAGEFWDDPLCPALRIDLASDAMARRIAAFACHRSQEQNLRYFYLNRESFRRAPDYDFTQPPPPKATLYGAESEARLMARIRDMIQERTPA